MPNLLRTIFSFLLVAFCWGFTNPFIRKGALGLDEATSHIKTPLKRTFASIIYLLRKPSYMVPLLLNLCGSSVYYWTLGEADLSLATPICNSLTFALTALAGYILGEEIGGQETWMGIVLILSGVSLCVYSKM